MFEQVTSFVRDLFGDGPTYLHEPTFLGHENKYLSECIETRFVSSVGPFVDRFEKEVAEYTGSPFAISTVNGTASLHIALMLAGVKPDEEVVTQALTFVATANAIAYCQAKPVFLDVERENLGLSPQKLKEFFENSCERTSTGLKNRKTGRRIGACVPVHIFGHPCNIEGLMKVCEEFGVPVVEDAAEGMGSLHKGKHLGTFGQLGTLSFNGNKILTTGGGGMILTADPEVAKRAKHLTTTARTPAADYIHDEIGYNYRMPNLNAALGCAQLEKIDEILENKIETAQRYKEFFNSIDLPFITEPEGARSNYWLNAILFTDRKERTEFLEFSAERKVFARPAWRPLNQLEIYSDCETDDLTVTKEIGERLVNLPSSYRLKN